MPNVSNVSTGKPKVAGAVYRAPVGTTLPTDPSTALDNAFVDMGYISEDGVTNANGPTTETVKDWGGRPVLVLTTERPDNFTLKFIEALNANVLKAVYGDANVAVAAQTGAISVTVVDADQVESSYVIDMIMRGGALKRIVIPNAMLGEMADIVYKADEAVGYEVTLSALLDSAGASHYEYILPAD